MPLGNVKGGIGYSAEFQSSALPWCTSSVAPANGGILRFDFGKVSRFIAVTNLAAPGTALRIGFTANGVTGSVVQNRNWFRVIGSSSFGPMELRVKSLYVCSDTAASVPFDLMVGLTSIDAGMMPMLTGSVNGTSSWDGVG